MGRGVSVPGNAADVFFLSIYDFIDVEHIQATYQVDGDTITEVDGSYSIASRAWDPDRDPFPEWAVEDAFDSIMWDLDQVIADWLPEAWAEDLWIGREDHVKWRTYTHYIGVSEYCGTVAVWYSAIPGLGNVPEAWSDISGSYASRMHKVGTMSNGVSVLKRSEETT
jgi:hypothetical protein